MSGKRFKPGEPVPETGEYMMVTPTGRSLGVTRYQEAGRNFSHTLATGYRYRFHRSCPKRSPHVKPVVLRQKCRAKIPQKPEG